MYKIDFKHPIHVHFIGIGGISMSGLARVLLMEGFKITGSDLAKSPVTKELQDLGVQIFYGQVASNIIQGIECVVYTAAISPENEELQMAKSKNLPLLTRAELLGQIMSIYKHPIAVAGTHGKTTTTSMISTVLLQSGLDPTISVGGILPLIKGNIRVGNSDIFITEACEYTNSFLDFNPKIGIILNIEEDHLDFYKDLDDIMNSFHLFAKKLPKDGTLIINGEIKNVEQITENLNCKVITYGLEGDYDYSATNITYGDNGNVSFDLIKSGEILTRVTLFVTGEHNVSNALATFAIGELLGLSIDKIKETIIDFKGTVRRFEYKGHFDGVHVIDDYAHHPTEILTTLNSVKHFPHKKLWCVFQPHTYTRTKSLFDDFVKVLSKVDYLILVDIYAAREKNTVGISSEDLLTKIKELGTDANYFSDFAKVEDFLKKNCLPGDLLITVGAGNVVDIGENLLK